ncbi:MAG: sulfide/dihydroorotate dehydrogenase-like FAD/NAD-binding protein [Nitrospina sp.]|nr:sulfide/dihydroorotate dehydrogenase-like FAD/NAD-binding protein [Nitrospina sp.]
MSKILEKTEPAPGVFRYVIEAGEIAHKARPGQFVIIRIDEHGERIPLTIADCLLEQNAIVLFVQPVGKTSIQLSLMIAGDTILDLAGPLGNPTEIRRFGTVALVGGGFGIAALYPIARELTRGGNRVITLLGARTESRLLLRQEMESVSAQVHISTDDGSCGLHGNVTDALSFLIQSGEKPDRVIAIGPLIMMEKIAELTRPLNIKTLVSMNPIMIDGTGMCGACRVQVAGEMKFACVDGPEFDGHEVDFDTVINRLGAYKKEEKESSEEFEDHILGPCSLGERAP